MSRVTSPSDLFEAHCSLPRPDESSDISFFLGEMKALRC